MIVDSFRELAWRSKVKPCNTSAASLRIVWGYRLVYNAVCLFLMHVVYDFQLVQRKCYA